MQTAKWEPSGPKWHVSTNALKCTTILWYPVYISVFISFQSFHITVSSGLPVCLNMLVPSSNAVICSMLRQRVVKCLQLNYNRYQWRFASVQLQLAVVPASLAEEMYGWRFQCIHLLHVHMQKYVPGICLSRWSVYMHWYGSNWKQLIKDWIAWR